MFDQSLPILEAAFRRLEAKLPPPVPTIVYGQTYSRYTEQSPEQAILQKLARYVSGLKAMTILLLRRMLQEEVVIKRTLDELGDDIMFLLLKPSTPEEVALHKDFLDAFYQETFDEGVAPVDSKKRRKSVPRHKIRNYVDRRTVGGPEKGKQAAALIYHVYSSFVHSASPNIMEMCSRHDLKFEVSGIRDIDLFESHVRDGVNYFIRGFYNIAALASVLGESAMFQALRARGDALEHAWD